MVTFKAWCGASALTIGMGAGALACSGAATADTAGPAPHHTITATHSPVKPVAHNAPRPKPSAALIAASTVTGVANHKSISAVAVNQSAATTSAPPNPTANAAPSTVGGLVQTLQAFVSHISAPIKTVLGIVAFAVTLPAFLPIYLGLFLLGHYSG